MTLNASGPISLGGTTVGQSINLELGFDPNFQNSLDYAPTRTLAGVASGAISFSNFYGKSSAASLTMTIGGFTSSPYRYNGYSAPGNPTPPNVFGSLSPGTTTTQTGTITRLYYQYDPNFTFPALIALYSSGPGDSYRGNFNLTDVAAGVTWLMTYNNQDWVWLNGLSFGTTHPPWTTIGDVRNLLISRV